ncbi:MAG: hypothetical protein GXY53_05650 [Desulfobulbus sp.]|nr:hypothetical protein [Desulfobulbus sp.]
MHLKWIAALPVFLVLLYGCAAAPITTVADPALKESPFDELVAEAQQHIGKTVILGGYVLTVENRADQTRLVALQTPLSGQEPGTKDLSQGRLILLYRGFLDPEVYSKDRKITVAGTITGSSATESAAEEEYPFLRLQVEQIYLWPKPVPQPYRPYDYWHHPYYYDPWWRPYPWHWRHRYYRWR